MAVDEAPNVSTLAVNLIEIKQRSKKNNADQTFSAESRRTMDFTVNRILTCVLGPMIK